MLLGTSRGSEERNFHSKGIFYRILRQKSRSNQRKSPADRRKFRPSLEKAHPPKKTLPIYKKMPRPTHKRAATRAAAEASREKRRREDAVRRDAEATLEGSGSEWTAEVSLLHAGFFEDPEEMNEQVEAEIEESQGEEEKGIDGRSRSGRVEEEYTDSEEREDEEDEGEMEVKESVLEEMMQNKAIWKEVEEHQHFRYQRGATSSRQTE